MLIVCSSAVSEFEYDRVALLLARKTRYAVTQFIAFVQFPTPLTCTDSQQPNTLAFIGFRRLSRISKCDNWRKACNLSELGWDWHYVVHARFNNQNEFCRGRTSNRHVTIAAFWRDFSGIFSWHRAQSVSYSASNQNVNHDHLLYVLRTSSPQRPAVVDLC